MLGQLYCGADPSNAIFPNARVNFGLERVVEQSLSSEGPVGLVPLQKVPSSIRMNRASQLQLLRWNVTRQTRILRDSHGRCTSDSFGRRRYARSVTLPQPRRMLRFQPSAMSLKCRRKALTRMPEARVIALPASGLLTWKCLDVLVRLVIFLRDSDFDATQTVLDHFS
jgi:hypothetical protein